MTVTDATTETLHHLDWQPACELGHVRDHAGDPPPATHLAVPLNWPCTCGPILICDLCTAWFRELQRKLAAHGIAHPGCIVVVACWRCKAAWSPVLPLVELRPL